MSTDAPPFDAPHPAELDDDMPEPMPVREPKPKLLEPDKAIKPPHSLEAEVEVLSAVFVDGKAFADVAALAASDFYFERHRIVYAVMADLHERGTAIDLVTVMQALKDRGQYEKVGGARALSEILDRSGTVTNLGHYIGIVRSKARLREIIEAMQARVTQAHQDVHDVDAFVESTKTQIEGVLERVAKPAEPLRLESIADRTARGEPDWLEQTPPDVSALMRNPDGSPFMLDGRVGVISAAGGTGKSWLVIQLAIAVACGGQWLEHYGCRKGRVLLALGEEKDEEIWRRVWRVAKHLRLSEYERSEVARNLVPLGLDGEEVAFLHKSQDGNITSTPFFAQLQQALSRDDWRLVVLDPLSYFGGPEVEGDPYVATTLIRCGAKLTKSPGGPAVLFSAHSRKKQQGFGTKLDSDDTRGSSAIVDGSRWVCSVGKRSESIIALKVTKTNYTVAGDEVLLARGLGGVMRPATPPEIADDIEARKEARARGKA